MVNKNVLRKTYLEKRLFLSDTEYDRRNQRLFNAFTEWVDLHGVGSLHTFLPIAEKKEVNTWLIIHHLRKHFPDIEIYTSRSLKGGLLDHFLLEEDTRLIINKWGIPEPAEVPAVKPNRLDIILVPLIICDKTGHRIGYGKGYYDRFLSDYPDARKIGVSLSPPLDRIDFMDTLDVAMDSCLTPYQIYQF